MSITKVVVQGREAVPLRAVPFLTGGAIDSRALLEFVVREDYFAGYPPLQIVRIDSAGAALLVHPGELQRHLTDMKSDRSAARELQRERIPAGVWVWKDQVHALYSSVARDFAWEQDGYMVGFCGHWCEAPLLTPAEHALVHEALPQTSNPLPPSRSHSKFELNGLDMSLKQLAAATALELTRLAKGRRATRCEVAQKLAGTLKMPAKTVERRISAKWW